MSRIVCQYVILQKDGIRNLNEPNGRVVTSKNTNNITEEEEMGLLSRPMFILEEESRSVKRLRLTTFMFHFGVAFAWYSFVGNELRYRKMIMDERFSHLRCRCKRNSRRRLKIHILLHSGTVS